MNHQRILVVGPSWVGDMVMAQSLFKVLKQKQPESTIDVLALEWTEALLHRMPEVDGVISMPIGHGSLQLARRWKLGRALRNKRYDQAIILPNSFKSALIPYFAKIPCRTGWRGEMRYGVINDLRILNKSRYPLMVERFVALAQDPETADRIDFRVPGLSVDPEQQQTSLAELKIDHGSAPLLALCPGAEFGVAKQWPAQKYSELAKSYIDKGWSVWLFGSENDRAVCAEIKSELGARCLDLSGRTTLSQAIDLLAMAKAVVANDSGLMHIAAALELPLVVVYGSTDPGFTPPLGENSVCVTSGIDCAPCFKRECPLGHLKCLTELPVSEVSGALGRLVQ